MSTSDHEDDKPKPIAPPIPALQKRAQTFTTGARLRGIINSEIRTKHGTYSYKDIAYQRDIRILKIFHGEPEDDLECMLFPSALPSTPDRKSTSEPQTYKYTALSYWWGEDEPRNKIKMYNDTGGREVPQKMTQFNPYGIFYVQDNLDAALRQLRDKKNDVNVWVDAICIHQDDNTEKAAQVARMNEIYSEADNVFVWLGAGTGETKETFHFLREILNLQTLDRLIKKKETPEKWMLVINLMKNRWFSRRWVIQELALAKNACVRWGEEEMHWSSFSDAIALFITNHDSIREMYGRLKNFDNMQDSSSGLQRAQGRKKRHQRRESR